MNHCTTMQLMELMLKLSPWPLTKVKAILLQFLIPLFHSDIASGTPLSLFIVLFAEPTRSSDPLATVQETSTLEVDQNVVEKSYDSSEPERQLAFEKEAVTLAQSHSNGNDATAAVESSSSSGQDDAPKKSYASIVSSWLYTSLPRIVKKLIFLTLLFGLVG